MSGLRFVVLLSASAWRPTKSLSDQLVRAGRACRLLSGQGDGTLRKGRLDVTIKMGGPQVNGMQLLLAGETDVMMGYDFQVLKALEQGFP